MLFRSAFPLSIESQRSKLAPTRRHTGADSAAKLGPALIYPPRTGFPLSAPHPALTQGTTLVRLGSGGSPNTGHRGKRILWAGSGKDRPRRPGGATIRRYKSQDGSHHDHDQIGVPMPCMLVAVILHGRSDGGRTYRRHAALDGRAAGRCSTAPRNARIRRMDG